MSKFWVCDKCLPEEVEELAIGSLLKTPCTICGEAKEPNEMKCVRALPERLEKILIKRGEMIGLTVEVAYGAEDVEKMKGAIAAALQVPKEYLEPALTGHASLLVAMDKEISKMTKETAEHANATIADLLAKKLKEP